MSRPMVALLGMALVLGLTGCGEGSKLYPASKSEGVFFSVPTNWKALSTASLNKYEKESTEPEAAARQALVKWQVAYTTNNKLKVSEVFNLTAPSQPLVFARVRELESSEINSVSYNTLRDVIVPVTSIVNGDDPSAPDFQILTDQEIVQKGARGVQGSIVDGRPYLDANFLAEIEKYHSASVVAHREHRVPDVHLPVLG